VKKEGPKRGRTKKALPFKKATRKGQAWDGAKEGNQGESNKGKSQLWTREKAKAERPKK